MAASSSPAGGKRLVIVQSNSGKLFTVTAAGRTDEIDLGGGSVRNGDGILLTGKILYVVQNRDNKIARIALTARLDSGRITGYLTDPDDDRRSRRASLRGERPLRDDADADDPLRLRPGGEALSGRARVGQTSGILNVSPAP